MYNSNKKIDVSAIVVPKVTCDLPINPVPYNLTWTHIADINLADPSFGEPGRLGVLLGIDICMEVLRHSRRAQHKKLT